MESLVPTPRKARMTTMCDTSISMLCQFSSIDNGAMVTKTNCEATTVMLTKVRCDADTLTVDWISYELDDVM